MIPKVIHYCWYGGKRKPKLVKDCIQSWKKHLPDYKIIEWNEKNTDLSHPFIKEAYAKKKWAFVADYIRLDILSQYGGIYLDTDMLLLKNLDGLLINKCFFGAEDENFINCAIIGSIPRFIFIEQCKLLYDEIPYNDDLGSITIPRITTKLFNENYNFKSSFNDIIIKNEIIIYPAQYFYPFPFESKSDLKNYKNYIKKDSYAVHLWSSSWVEYSEFYYFRNSEYLKGFQKVIEKIVIDKRIRLKYLLKIASEIKQSFKK